MYILELIYLWKLLFQLYQSSFNQFQIQFICDYKAHRRVDLRVKSRKKYTTRIIVILQIFSTLSTSPNVYRACSFE